MKRQEAKMKKAKMIAPALAASALALLLAACGGLRTNPIESYKGLNGVQPYQATAPIRPVVSLNAHFNVSIYSDAQAQTEVTGPLAMQAGAPAAFFVKARISGLGDGFAGFALSARGLPEGMTFAAVEGQPGVYRISGTPTAGPVRCGAAAQGAAISFEWNFSGGETPEQIRVANTWALSDRLIERPYAIAQARAAIRVAVSEPISAAPGRVVDFQATAEGVETDDAHPPTLALPAGSAVSFKSDRSDAQALGPGKYVWRLTFQPAADAAPGAVRFTLNVANGCVEQRGSVEATATVTP